MKKQRGTSGITEGQRNLLFTRVAGAQNQAIPSRAEHTPTQSVEASTDFTTLPGYGELQLHASVGKMLGINNPFFRCHEARAGAETQISGRGYINFSSYDYLGLNGHPDVAAAAHAAIEKYGTSSSASRVVAGERDIHRALEAELARHYGVDAAVAMVSGYGTNVTAIGHLVGPRDLLVHDSLIHNSIVTGAKLSGAERRSFPHNDMPALDELLSSLRGRFDRVLIVVEGLYSMDGDFPDLAALVEIKRRHRAWLMVDEAHALGILGERGFGIAQHFGIDPRDVDIWMGTLSKTLAACGGYIAGPTPLVEYLKCIAGGFVYSVGMPPPIAAAALAALEILHREPERVTRLRRNGRLFFELARERNLDVGTSAGLAITPIILGDSLKAVMLSEKLFAQGINVLPIIHPAVPERAARLRFFITSEHTEEHFRQAVTIMAKELPTLASGQAILSQAVKRLI